MAVVIASEHPASPDATALIAELDAHLTPLYPSESRHGFSVDVHCRTSVVVTEVSSVSNKTACFDVLFLSEH